LTKISGTKTAVIFQQQLHPTPIYISTMPRILLRLQALCIKAGSAKFFLSLLRGYFAGSLPEKQRWK
jgi:hypothetical protein